MNNLPQSSAERAMEGYAQRITARLNEATTQLDYHVVERLRAGRVQALAHRKKAMSAPKPVPVFTRLGASLAWGGGSGGSQGTIYFRVYQDLGMSFQQQTLDLDRAISDLPSGDAHADESR